MRYFIACALRQVFYGGHIEEDKMGGTCSTNGIE